MDDGLMQFQNDDDEEEEKNKVTDYKTIAKEIF